MGPALRRLLPAAAACWLADRQHHSVGLQAAAPPAPPCGWPGAHMGTSLSLSPAGGLAYSHRTAYDDDDDDEEDDEEEEDDDEEDDDDEDDDDDNDDHLEKEKKVYNNLFALCPM